MSKRPYRFEVYQSWRQGKGYQWFWRARSGNSKIVADGSEGYTRKSDCLKAVERVKANVSGATVEVLE